MSPADRGCPVDHAEEDTNEDGDVSRRHFVRAALAVGGTSALSACVNRYGASSAPGGTSDPASLPTRQFAWNAALPKGPHGNVKIPNHQLILLFDYVGSGAPTEADREQVQATFDSLSRAYQWGTGDEFNPTSTTGLLWLVGYSRSYFDRFAESFPGQIDLARPSTVLEQIGETGATAPTPETYDAFVLLSSDEPQVLLRTEQALLGQFAELNGERMAASLDGVLEVRDRRTGFIGVGRPADRLDVDGVPDNSPTAMGFRSGFKDNQASEDSVAISVSPFADGTTAQISRIALDLDGWYDHGADERVELMFSPDHTEADIGEIGELLAGRSQVSRSQVDSAESDARERGCIGHTQKTAAARDENFEPLLLRRSEGVSTDLGEPGMNFLSLQEGTSDFVETRRAMNGEHLDDEVHAAVDDAKDGIRSYVNVRTRATFLVPPRSSLALPRPRPRTESRTGATGSRSP
jgi:hypothetical protein